MKFNGIYLVSLLLLAILTLGAASAAENVTADLAVEDAGDMGGPASDEKICEGDSSDDVGVGDNVTDEKLGLGPEEILSDPVEPTVTYEIDLPKTGVRYVANWGQPIVVSANYGNATGMVVITFADETYSTNLVDGAFTYTITKYNKIASNYYINVEYKGDENYKSSSFNERIQVKLDAVATDAVFGQSAFVNVNLYNATGNVSFTVNGVTYRKELVDGVAVQEIKNYNTGSNSISFAYEGDEKYNPISRSLSLNIGDNISATGAVFGQSAFVNVNLYNATGNVSFTVNGVTYRKELVDGVAVQEIKNYKVGSNTVTVKYDGDGIYGTATKSLNFNTQLNDISAIGVNFGQSAFVNVNLYNATGNVSFIVNGVTYIKELVDGVAVQEIKNYTLGSNTVKFTYGGDGVYGAATKSITFRTTADIDAPTIYNFQQSIITVNVSEATGNVTFVFGNDTQTVAVVDGIAIYETHNYNIGENTVSISYSGDNTFNSFSTTAKFTVLEKENTTILSSVYKTADKNMVLICIPYGTGNVTALINGKKEVLELKNGFATYDINDGVVINEINVTYDGNYRLNPGNSSNFVNLADNIVNNETYMYYFNQRGYGNLFDFIEPGTTLDFQGAVINNLDSSDNVFMNINKPVNIISTTGDGLICFNRSTSSVDKHTANGFIIENGGSGSNITGITFYNTKVSLSNVNNVVLDNISFYIVDNSVIGAGTGALTFRNDATYVTLKNSYIYGENTGSTTIFTLSWADHCILDNNTWITYKNTGPVVYYNYYNIVGITFADRDRINSYNNFTNNKIYSVDGQQVQVSIQSGSFNLFEKNTLIKTTISSNLANNCFIGNIVNDGGSISAGSNNVVVANNVVDGALSGGSIVYNNTVLGTMTVSGEAYNNTINILTVYNNALVYDNIITGSTNVGSSNAQIYDNKFIGDNTITVSGENNIFANNNIIGNFEFSSQYAKNNKIVNNIISTSADYAIDLKTYTNTENNISNNILNSAKGFGNDAVNHAKDSTLIIDNYQNTTAKISVEANDIKVGETVVVNIMSNETAIKSVDVVVNGKKYIVNLSDGKGSLELTDLFAGTYDVSVTSNDLTYGAQNTTTFEVNKNVYPEIVVDAPAKTQWIDSNITVTIKDATGSVTLDINGSELTAEIVDGVAIFVVPDLAYGTYDFNITYPGDYKYFGNETNGTLTVNKNKEVKIIASDVVVDAIADKFTAKFANYIDEAIANANVTVTVGDEIYSLVTDENGTVTADLALSQGKYDVKVEFMAIEDEYDATSADYTITVIDKSTLKIASIDGEGIITGLLVDALGNPIANASIVAKMNGVETNLTTDGDGLFKFQAKNGFEVSFEFAGDNTTTLSDTSITLNNVAHVLKDTSINLTNVSRVAVDTGAGEKGKAYTFTLSDAQGNAVVNKTVKVALNGKVYEAITNENGTASIVISLNAAKTYNLNVFFMGDDDYKGSTAAAKVTVTKKKTTLKAAKTKYSFKAKAKSKVIKATLKTSNKYLKSGKKVTIKIKGKTYTAKVGKKGVVKINIKKLTKKGTYKAKIKFAGDSAYKASNSKTIKIVIK